MIRNQIHRLRNSIRGFFSADNIGYIAIPGMIIIVMGGLISLAQIDMTPKLVIFALAMAVIIGFTLCVRTSVQNRHEHEADAQDDGDQQTPEPKAAPSKPEHPPTIGMPQQNQEDDEDINRKLLTVLASIDRSNKEAERRRAQEELDRQLQQKRIDELVNSNTVRYDEIPGFVYFVKRGLWQIALAWTVFGIILAITLSATGEVVERGEVLFLVLIFLACVWVFARAVGDWRWTHRRVEGIRVKVNQPKNAFLLLFGGDYSISIFECGNAVVKKTKYERFLFLRTATVSIDTPRKNTEDDKDSGDVFNAMENMRRPYEFRDIVLDLHEKLTMSQPNTIKRSGQ